MDQNYNVSKKGGNGKWWTYGKIRLNKFGKYDLGMRVTPELRTLLDATPDGSYLNFSLFPDDRDQKQPKRDEQQKPAADEFYEGKEGEVPF